MSPGDDGSGNDKPPMRCAIYTRKSTGENLDMDFNTLDAQRESAELYIRSQAHEGWEVVPDRYDDGGYTGANMDRPALRRLMDDVDAGKIDCVVVYKVDRLSRSLLDFARLIDTFDKRGISFVSTTQQFNTATSLGRLVLNILLSFAQFEREMISERTRDKMAAARRKGKWVGGPPVLGYRVNRDRRRLEVLPAEAEQVRTIFNLYLRFRSIAQVNEKLHALGWRKKSFTTKDGRPVGGKPWDKNTLHRLLRNPIYIGQVAYRGDAYEGEHEAIVDRETFDKVQAVLSSKVCGRGRRRTRNPDYLLATLVRCQCGSPMTTTSARGRSSRDYRYYICRRRHLEGQSACAHPRVNATDIEPVVLERIRAMCAEPKLREQLAARMSDNQDGLASALATERQELESRIADLNHEAKQLLAMAKDGTASGTRIISERIGELELELDALRARAGDLDDQLRGIAEVARRAKDTAAVLDSFDDLWEMLVPEERLELIRLLVARIDVDEPKGVLEIHFHDLSVSPPVDGLSIGLAKAVVG